MRNGLLLLSLIGLMSCGDNTEVESQQATTATPIYAPAELVSLQDISVSPPSIPRVWEYKIEFLATENALVEAGDLLVKFDGQRLRTMLIERKSELSASQKEAERQKLENEAKLEQLILNLAEAKKNMEIAKRKMEITDVSRSEIERKKQEAQYVIASELHMQAINRVAKHREVMVVNELVQKSKISKAQSRVDVTNESISRLSVKAPKSGMVILTPNYEGDKPAVGDTVYMGSQLLTLPSLEMIAVKVEFDESDTIDVNLGDEVRVTLDGYPERPFTGEIGEIGKSYRQKSNNNLKVVFDAWVTLENMDMEIMRPGMKATVELTRGQS